MTNDIIQELKNALRNDRYPYDETVYVRAIEQIELLRDICNDLYHDATCMVAFCRLCGDGIKQWEAYRD